MTRRILITGCRGMLGTDLMRVLGPAGQVYGLDIESGNLSDPLLCGDLLDSHRPEIVVNAAAYTNVDAVEDPTVYPTAFAANATAPKNLAEQCAQTGALLVHISTDYVYDGEKMGAYVETDPPNPVSAYGRTKLAGDEAILASGCRHLILRTAWLFGPRGKNFVEAILKGAAEKSRLSVVDDQHGSPTSTIDLANAIRTAIEKDVTGLYHFTCRGQTTWFGFAGRICELAGIDVPIEPITSRDLGLPARRPKNSVLDGSAFFSATGFVPHTWEEALEDYLRQSGRLRAQASSSD